MFGRNPYFYKRRGSYSGSEKKFLLAEIAGKPKELMKFVPIIGGKLLSPRNQL